MKRLEVAKQDTMKQEDLKAQMENFLQVRNTFDGRLVWSPKRANAVYLYA